MLKNYLKIALRNLSRHKVSSIINISGLAIGLASVLLIGMYVKDELNYRNNDHPGDSEFSITQSCFNESYKEFEI